MSQQNLDIYDCLALHAKLRSPTPKRDSDVIASTKDIAQEEAAWLDIDWKPITTRFDYSMVDSLLSALETHFKNNPASISQSMQESLFLDAGSDWEPTNDNEEDVSDVLQ